MNLSSCFNTPWRRLVTAGIGTALGVCAVVLSWTPLRMVGSDHGDMPQLGMLQRHDARITDLHAFTRENNLVLMLCVNPAVPVSAAAYRFSSDIALKFHIDHHTPVSYDNPEDLSEFGGTILDPARINEDILIEFTFDRNGEPVIRADGLPQSAFKDALLFTGLRDDPFIRGPRAGRNIGAVVLELPLDQVLGESSTLLIWATSKVPELQGHMADHAGRSLRSMFPENNAFNSMRPRDQFKLLGVQPDVVILDTSHPSGYPNGRLLTDDVVNLVNDSRVLADDQPFPTENDMEFLEEFPYLAPPHLPR